MFSYYLRLAILSIKRNPILSTLMVTAIALGIGACMTTYTVNYLMSADPIPSKSDQLFYVQLDSWDPNTPFDEPNEPPDQLTWTDGTNLLKAHKAYKQVLMATSSAAVEPPGKDAKPFIMNVRLTSADFFSMFNVPFQYGHGWDQQNDNNRDLVVVLDQQTNEKAFGGINSVGKTLRIAGRNFTVVGVLKDWQPVPRFYDLTTDKFGEPAGLFMPIYLKEELQMVSHGNVNCWKPTGKSGFKAFLYSECINFQFWAQLRNNDEKQQYMQFLNNYVNEQKAMGRFARPLNNRLTDVVDWMKYKHVVADDAQIMLWLSLMFLLVCLLNTVGLMLAKFSGKVGEISLRRAVGASRRDLFIQHLVETACIGLLGGVFGLLLALLGLQGIKALYGEFADKVTTLDGHLIMLAIAVAVVTTIAAGLYPTWRACAIAPARYLKDQ